MKGDCSKLNNDVIIDFIAANKIATVCCAKDNMPYCFNCFFSLRKDERYLIFKSSESSKHMQMLAKNNLVAGTISSLMNSLTKMEGIQFEGRVVDIANIDQKVSKFYYMQYPLAIAIPGKVWVIELTSLKYTNTTNGIKHKEYWGRVL